MAQNILKNTGVSVCYFCHERIPDSYLQGHSTQCSLVIEPCINHCEAWVQRRHREFHAKECPKRHRGENKPTPSSSRSHVDDVGSVMQQTETPLSESAAFLKQQICLLRSGLNEEVRQRLQVITDLGSMKKRQQEYEDWNSKEVLGVVSALRTSLNCGMHRINSSVLQCRTDVENLNLTSQVFEEWKNQVEIYINGLGAQIVEEGNQRSHLEIILNQQDSKLRQLKQLENDLETVKEAIWQEQSERENLSKQWHGDFNAYKEIIKEEDEIIKNIWLDQLKEMQILKTKMQELVAVENELKTNYDSLQIKVEDLSRILSEDLKLYDKHERDIDIFRKKLAQMNHDLIDYENNLTFHVIRESIQSCEGNIIWKISDFKSKMDAAKLDDITLHSPMFCNKRYGYTLRMELNLNGIGKWRGRHMTVCLQVVHGQYDALLEWPFSTNADIILRDQHEAKSEIKNIVKSLVARRTVGDCSEDVAKKMDQHIFIPHETLQKRNYIKNNAMYLEVIIKPAHE